MKGNRLSQETSPYLLQHANNPVDWYPWGKEALDRAKQEDLPILLSIGYSACHWCHVMERESFEDQQVADIMNKSFVCIKLDREQRPDVDQIYMEAIQTMGIPGGWPLNVFLTPDREPFYGGTYFPKNQWSQLLENIAKAFNENRKALEDSAEKFKAALNVSVVEKYGLALRTPEDNLLTSAIEKMTADFDSTHGGMDKAPKFPMPVIWNFLLHYCAKYPEPSLLKHLYLTLDKIALGGIYDQIGGGFARYSVDDKWFAPHFEKMLYDNAQLISLYAQSYALSHHELYKDVVYQTIEFFSRELCSPEGGFYSALDADSEGVEGKFYIWEYQEFAKSVEGDGDFLVGFFGVTPEGNWESGQNILHCRQSLDAYASEHGIDPVWAKNVLNEYRESLMTIRANRIRPGLDNKVICGWNGLAIKGLTDAYAAFGESRFLKMALDCAKFLESFMRAGDQLYRMPQSAGEKIPAFLEDYAAVISGYLGLYEATFDEKWLYSAQNLMSFAIENFYDEEDSLFFFTDKQSISLIARKKELFDNVIPSSNSLMAGNLLILGTILERSSYLEIYNKMIGKVSPLISRDPAYMSQWGTAYSMSNFTRAEIVIGGSKAETYRKKIAAHFHPHRIMIGSANQSTLPLLENRVDPKITRIYICYNQTCQLPTSDPEEAIKQLSYLS